MQIPSVITGALSKVIYTCQKHSVLLSIFLILCGVAVTTRYLLFAEDPPVSTSIDSDPLSSPQACSSENTPFASIENLDTLERTFKDKLEVVTEERLTYLSTPSAWKCDAENGFAVNMPKLQKLADEFPGWSRQYFPLNSTPFTRRRPVTFDRFSSVTAEVLRAYECRLTELKSQSIPMVLTNQDFPEGTQFCCTDIGKNGACVEKERDTICGSEVSDSPTCDNACPVSTNISDLFTRIMPYRDTTFLKRKSARLALERVIMMLRSFEVNQLAARNIQCALRLSLDLKNELGLLAETMSCLPRIWDAATSLHDPQSQE
jgi:hypothetical protein